MNQIVAEKTAKYTSLVTLVVSGAFIMILDEKIIGYPILLAGALMLYLAEEAFVKRALSVYVLIAILGLTPAATTVDKNYILITAGLCLVAICLLYVLVRFIYKDKKVQKYFFTRNGVIIYSSIVVIYGLSLMLNR